MRKAFTLIELLAVIVIIAVVALIGGFTVSKIMQKVRHDALTDTALSARKATEQLVVSEGQFSGTKEFELTPGGQYASILDVNKDPWGNDYEYIKAVAYIENDKMKVDLYLKSTTGCYLLASNSSELKEDFTCGSIKPTALTANLNSDNSYTISWENGNAPFKVYVDGTIKATINNRSYQYYPLLGNHQVYVAANGGQVSDTKSFSAYEELGGSNTLAANAFAPGWYISKAGGTVATINVVNDAILNKDVIEAVMTTKASWGSVLKYNVYSGEQTPVFNPLLTYRIEFKARLVSDTAGRYFGILETDGTGLLWEAPYYNLNPSWQTFTTTFVAGAEGPSPVFYHYMAENSAIRIADLKITNVIN